MTEDQRPSYIFHVVIDNIIGQTIWDTEFRSIARSDDGKTRGWSHCDHAATKLVV
jgi:hypothetical protein